MVGTTLREIRHEIERLASDDGDYYVVCARSGERPVPVAGHRFATRTAAADAARVTEQYRAALRRYDPQLPYYDPIVRQEQPLHVGDGPDDPSEDTGPISPQPVDHGGEADDPLISFCHDVSGAVFEALSESNHDEAETAIMETYLAAAEATTDRNTLCLVLLEAMAAELERHLTVDERTRLLRTAAANLPPVPSATDPIEASLAHLDSLSLVRAYDVAREPRTGTDAWSVSLRGYAIDCDGRRFPTLPIGIDILRRASEVTAALSVTDVTALGEGDWELVVTSDVEAAGGLVCLREDES
ncbi:hypothetical protein Htur_3681 [Haloterrigena turkmenica DSM 5511]|uniref:Uncharacterized protein n=1 Tax=Haloterrigena turkmenica (strain ATCC 51198 / DSM 5511 / JCM 9101 / NCIMB 13204 / VKM B-1734 / 4k) TaxID=543526 RepID=D2RRS6_HALTV|nr:hypothetical protein [Haloterrigena turkmenica]ADB62543.1 hypothetical protein Htur_3681 [Haloterrigena turkmenica DSM 5511]